MVKIEMKLEEDKEFMKQVKDMVISWIRSSLYDGEEASKQLLASAIDQFFSWKGSSIEKFTRNTIVELIGSAVDDKSTLPNEKKAENVIIRLLREEIANFVAEKFKNITISGFDG